MVTGTQIKIATSVLQVLVLIFAGFATVLYQIYESDIDDLSHRSPKVIAWLFMSIGVVFILPAFLLILLVLASEGGKKTDTALFLFGSFITLPSVFLSVINIWIGVSNGGNIDWPGYQRAIHILSGLAVIITASIILYHIFINSLI